MGCEDGASVTLRTPDGVWPNGAYTFRFTFDNHAHTCTLTVPDELPAEGYGRDLACAPVLGVVLHQEVECTTSTTADGVSQSCTPLPGQYRIDSHIGGTPTAFELMVERDGEALITETLELHYRQEEPNGPDCPPVCQRANIEFVLE